MMKMRPEWKKSIKILTPTKKCAHAPHPDYAIVGTIIARAEWLFLPLLVLKLFSPRIIPIILLFLIVPSYFVLYFTRE